MSLCKTNGCQFFSRSETQDGYCSICYTRRELRKDGTTEVGIDTDDEELPIVALSHDLVENAIDDTFDPSDDRTSSSATNEIVEKMKTFAWKAIDVERTIDGMRAANLSDDVPLSVVQLTNVDLEAVLQKPREHPTAVLSWRWDISNRIAEHEYVKQQSRNLAIAVEKAQSVGVNYLFVDAFSLRQYPQVNVDEVVLFLELYSRIRVVTTFVAEEWNLPPGSYELEADSYPLRAWLLIESSRYINNPSCSLNDLLTIQEVEESRLMQAEISTNDPTNGYRHGVQKYCQEFLRPIRTDISTSPSFWKIDAMPRRGQDDLPVTDLFENWSENERKFSCIHTILENLAMERSIVLELRDLLKAATKWLFGETTGLWLLSLLEQIQDRDEHELFVFCVLLLFLNRLFPSIMVEHNASFGQDMMCLLLRAGFKIDQLYPIQPHVIAFWLREDSSSDSGVRLLLSVDKVIAVGTGWFDDPCRSDWTQHLIVSVVERLARTCCAPKTRRQILRKRSEECLKIELERRKDGQVRKRRAGDELGLSE